MKKLEQAETLAALLDLALSERPASLTPEKHNAYRERMSRLIWTELAEYREIVKP